MLTARELFARAEELERRAKRLTDPSTTLSMLKAAQNLRRVAASPEADRGRPGVAAQLLLGLNHPGAKDFQIGELRRELF